MKYRKLPAAIAAILTLMLIVFGCAAPAAEEQPSASPAGETAAPAPAETSEPEEPEDTSVSVTDMMGRSIEISGPVEKVVALTASDCEILYAIGAGDTLVGRGEYCDYPEAALAVPTVQSGYETNIEQIIALEPQVVFMNAMDQSEEQVNGLEAVGITVVMNSAADIEGVYESVRLMGMVMGKNTEAEQVIAGMKTTFDDISSKVSAEEEKKTVYFEISPLEYGLWTAGTGTFMNELAEMLGVENAFADVEGWVEISEEQVIERDPDFIITTAMSYGDGSTPPSEEILQRKGWENIKAIKNGAVLNADSNEATRPGPRLANAAETLYNFFYGENE